MNLGKLSIALFVKNIDVSRSFYRDILKFEIELDFGKNIIFRNGLAVWEIRASHIIPMTLGADKIRDTSVIRSELYFETETIDEDFRILKENNVSFLHELHEESWGQRTIRFFDPDRHLIEIGESMTRFVSRYHKQGMTADQISERTHVPVEEVIRLIAKNNSF